MDAARPAASSPEQAADATASFSELPRRQVIGTLVGIMLALLLSALDQTIVGTAMPRIVAELRGFEHYAWVTTAYLVCSTAVVPIVGKLSDLYGRKPFFVSGTLIFLAASALCGVAQDMLQLVVFRGVQGLGAGFITSMTFIVIGDLFPPARRGQVQGVFGAVFGLASIVGPLLGGYLTDNLSWRWVFFVNLPVGVVALIALVVLFPHLRPPRREHVIDYSGAATLVVGVVALLLALSWGGHDYPWGSPQILGMIALGLVMAVLFVRIERGAREPIIPLSLFGNPIIRICLLAVTLTSIGMFGTILFVPLFIQGVIGTGATSSGLVLMPMTLGMVLGSTASGQLISRTGRYRPMAIGGLVGMFVGTLLLSRLGVDASYSELLVDMTILGLGLGTTFPVFTLAVQNAVPYAQLGAATASTQFFRSIGGTLGAAIFGSLLTNRYAPLFHGALPTEVQQRVPVEYLAQFDNPQVLLNPQSGEELRQAFDQLGPQGPALLGQVLEAIRYALAVSIHEMFVLGTVVVAAAVVAVLFLQEIPLRRSHRAGGPAAEEAGREMAASGMATDVSLLPEDGEPECLESGVASRTT